MKVHVSMPNMSTPMYSLSEQVQSPIRPLMSTLTHRRPMPPRPKLKRLVVPYGPQGTYIAQAFHQLRTYWVGFTYVGGVKITLSRKFTTLKLLGFCQIKCSKASCLSYSAMVISLIHQNLFYRLCTYPCMWNSLIHVNLLIHLRSIKQFTCSQHACLIHQHLAIGDEQGQSMDTLDSDH